MAVLGQCGYGRSDKIEQAFNQGLIEGVILSPRDERRSRLEQAVAAWSQDFPQFSLFFDPQFYVATLNTPRDGHLSEYEYYNNNSGLTRTQFSGTRIRRYVKECLDYQHGTFGNRIESIISPSILFDGFRDYWSQVAINMAVEAADYHSSLDNPQPLLITIVFSETALQSMDSLEEFLDALTDIDAEGFYIIVRRNSASLQNAMESTAFGKLLYFCYVLSVINEYRVIVGYSDWHSFLLEVAGVTHTACGWYQNLRHFSLARFQPAAGGRRPRKRYSAINLFSSPLITPELQDIHLAGLLPIVLSGSPFDMILSSGPTAGEANWSDDISCLAHWYSLSRISHRLSSLSDVQGKLQEAGQMLRNASTLYSRLQRRGVSFDPTTGPDHISEWLNALQEFRGIARL